LYILCRIRTVSVVGMRIGELARRTGVGVSALRAWERRYHLLQPARTPAGHRLYGEDDVERVRAVVRLVEEGLNLGAAVARVGQVGPGALPLGEGEELLHGQILDLAAVGIWVARFGRTRYANRRLADLLGHRRDALVQLPVADLFAPGELERLDWSTQRVRGGEPSTVNPRLQRADGSTFVARMDARPLLGPTGAYEGAVAVIDDATQSTGRDEMLRLQSSLLDAVSEATIIARPDGTLVHVNAAAERTFGHRAADVLGRDGREVLFSPETSVSAAEIHRQVMGGRRYAGRVRIVRHDGSSLLAHSTVKVVDDEAGEPLGIVSVVQDQTEVERVRSELRNREVQAEALAVLGSHALRVAGDPDVLAEVVVEAVETARRLVRADLGTALVLAGDDRLEVHPALPPLGPLGPLKGSMASLVRLARQPVLVRDTSIDPRFEPGEACSAIGAPIGGPHGVAGVLVAVSGSPDRIDPAGTHFFQSIANLLGALLVAGGR
jgi:PAS domain S-box-containing protein